MLRQALGINLITKFFGDLHRVLVTVKNSVVNTVFPIWPIVELPNLCFPNTLSIKIEYQNVKIVKSEFKSEKSKKNKHKYNVLLKENKKKDIKLDMMCAM